MRERESAIVLIMRERESAIVLIVTTERTQSVRARESERERVRERAGACAYVSVFVYVCVYVCVVCMSVCMSVSVRVPLCRCVFLCVPNHRDWKLEIRIVALLDGNEVHKSPQNACAHELHSYLVCKLCVCVCVCP